MTPPDGLKPQDEAISAVKADTDAAERIVKTHKKCSGTCGEVKPLFEFFKFHLSGDGHMARCKRCDVDERPTRGLPDLDRIQHGLMLCLKRETKHLQRESMQGKLSSASSKALIEYLKYSKVLQQFEARALKDMGDDELRQLASKDLSDPVAEVTDVNTPN